MSFPNNVAIMRHAKFADGKLFDGEEAKLLSLAELIREYLGRNQSIRICHSTLERAVATADTLSKSLLSVGISDIEISAQPLLNCGKKHINEENLQRMMQGGGFHIFISHLPDIMPMVAKYFDTANAKNCDFYSNALVVQHRKQNSG